MNQNNKNTMDNNLKNNSKENSFPIIISNSYIKKYYLDNRLSVLPSEIKNTIKKLFVELTETVGGIAIIYYDIDENDLIFRINKEDDDYNFDEIEANYKLSRIEKENEQLFREINSFCKFKFNGLI